MRCLIVFRRRCRYRLDEVVYVLEPLYYFVNSVTENGVGYLPPPPEVPRKWCNDRSTKRSTSVAKHEASNFLFFFLFLNTIIAKLCCGSWNGVF